MEQRWIHDYINPNEIPGELSHENMISPHVKIASLIVGCDMVTSESRLLKRIENEMTWHFMGVYIINRT